MTRRFVSGLLLAALALAARARADEPLPPPEAGEGDYTLELADTLGSDELEVSVGAESRGRSAARRSQRVSFRGGGASGTLRDGDDALSGGRVSAPFARGELVAGRLAPRWGRGLVLGGAAEAWSRSAEDRGEHARYRGRAGDGLAYESTPLALLAGRFAKRRVVGGRVRRGPASLALLRGERERQASVAFGGEDRSLEWAADARGRWRSELALGREANDTRVTLRLRGGHAAFRPLAEPARAGPAVALVAAASRQGDLGTVSVFGAWWRWRAGADGARGALEVTARMGQHAAFACGAEQQHGATREPASRTRPGGPRQGLWCEYRGGSPAARLTLRHELWGTRAFARDAVRRAVVARAEWTAPFGSRVAVQHAVWLARRGEDLHLPEPEADRLVLRALSGAGSRTRVEWRAPFASGEIRLGSAWATGGTRGIGATPAWTVQWSQRSRLGQRGAHGGDEHEVRGADGPSHHRRIVRHARARQGARGEGPERHPPGDR